MVGALGVTPSALASATHGAGAGSMPAAKKPKMPYRLRRSQTGQGGSAARQGHGPSVSGSHRDSVPSLNFNGLASPPPARASPPPARASPPPARPPIGAAPLSAACAPHARATSPPTERARSPPTARAGGTRRVRLVRKEGRDVSSQYGREGGGGRVGGEARNLSVDLAPSSYAAARGPPGRGGGGGPGAVAHRRAAPGAARGRRRRCAPLPPPGTERTRRVPSPVLSGHVASLPPYCARRGGVAGPLRDDALSAGPRG